MQADPKLNLSKVENGQLPPLSRRIFDKYDKDQSGNIDAKDFGSLCYDLGYFLSPQEVQVAVNMIDQNGDGKINLKEFTHFWATDARFDKLRLSDKELEWMYAAVRYFRFFDKDSNGLMDRNEFAKVHADLVKNGQTSRTLDQVLGDIDTSGDGQVSFNEYVQWWKKPRAQR
eukprot:TRINITY_DN16084_c0_g1_i1.p1 TRINITY_DN16084_c0_g1~~TRINITY_DN16084_c0_g1_i1.p1  ORF type:complete len:186 (+),score=52.65 TRINITY_DN16084_c0_g1_i1:45-560(+)